MYSVIACGTTGYPGCGLDRVFAGLASAGFRYVELAAIPSPQARIPVEAMDAAQIQGLRNQLASHGLTAVSLSGHSDLIQPEGVAHLKARIDFAAALGVTIVNTGAGHAESKADEERFFAHMTQEIIPYAAARGVKIALETHGGLTGTAEDCLRTLDRLGSPWVGINYDPANVIYYRGVRPEEDIVRVAAHVIHVHLKDKRGDRGVYDFPLLGEGTIDFRALVATLRVAGYQGPYSAEIEVEGGPSPEEQDQMRRRTYEFMAQLLL
jgi:L-ribulose-5-phosphate 3-epimerase